MVFLTSIESIIPIIVLIILGYFLQVRGWFDDSFGGNLSKLIMNVAMPVSIFVSVLKYLTLDKLIRVCLKTKNCTIPYFLIKYKKQSIGDYSHGTKTL